jgi:hypothetical protein
MGNRSISNENGKKMLFRCLSGKGVNFQWAIGGFIYLRDVTKARPHRCNLAYFFEMVPVAGIEPA